MLCVYLPAVFSLAAVCVSVCNVCVLCVGVNPAGIVVDAEADPECLIGSDEWVRQEKGFEERKAMERKSIYVALFGQGGTLKALRHGSHSFTCK